MSARDLEDALVERCLSAARKAVAEACDPREANVFRVASMVLFPDHPLEAAGLHEASQRYFDRHPDQLVDASQVLRLGWIQDLPRLRASLRHRLDG